MKKINVAVVGVGNFTRALMEGVAFYTKNPEETVGLMNPFIGAYQVKDIHFVAGFDVDERKVSKKLSEAVEMEPNVPMNICKPLDYDAMVYRGPTLGSIVEPMKGRFVKESKEASINIAEVLKQNKVEVLVNLLPTGSDEATYLYAEASLEAGCHFINCIPTPLATQASWVQRFEEKGLVLLGDDIKSQLGATMLNRQILQVMKMRGIKIERSEQENKGGNTDHFNLLYRATAKEKSKRTALTEFLSQEDARPVVKFTYTGIPSGHKEVQIHIEGRIFGNTPIKLFAKIEDEISVNGAGVAVDAIRVAKLLGATKCVQARETNAFLMKSPLKPMSDFEAFDAFEKIVSLC